MRLLLIVLCVLWSAPMKMGIAFRWQEGCRLQADAGVMLWGIRFLRRLYWPGRKNEPFPEHDAGWALQKEVETPPGGDAKDQKGVGAVLRLVRWVWTGDRARHWFSRMSRVEKAQLSVQVGFDDAAACALADAFVKAGLGILRNMLPSGKFHSRVAFGGKCAVQGMCIVSIRLGNLLTAAIMGAAAYIASHQKRKEEKRWSIIPLKN